MFISYWKVAQKKAMVVFMRAIRYFFCAIILLGVGIWICSMMLQNRQILQQIDVAVVVPEENAQALEFLTDLVSAMKSVKSVCHFEYMTKDEALGDLRTGDVQSILVFSKHMYDDLDQGRNTSVQLYVASDTTISVQMFQELLKDGISMIWTAEAGVYAVLDQAEPDNVNLDYEDVGMQVATYYLKVAFDRAYIFDSEMISPYGVYGQKEYFFSTAVIWMLLLMGMGFEPLYYGQSRAVESKLRMYGMGPVKVACANILAMTNMLMLVVGVCYLTGCIVTWATQQAFLFFDIRVIGGLVLLCLTFAVWYHLLYTITRRSGIGILTLVACEAILALGSGLIVPVSYLPKFVGQISRYLPLYEWNQFNMGLLFGSISIQQVGVLALWGLFGGILGVIAVCEKY